MRPVLRIHSLLAMAAFGVERGPKRRQIFLWQSGAREQGGILGVNQALGALARSLGPVVGSFVFGAFGHGYPFYTGAAVMLAVFVIAWKSM